MRIYKTKDGIFLTGKAPCGICAEMVRYRFTPAMAEFYLSRLLMCEDCDIHLKAALIAPDGVELEELEDRL